MKKIWDLFEKLHLILEDDMDLKTCQELHILATKLVNHAAGRHDLERREWKDKINFFRDVTTSASCSFGQCGERVYWKVIDEVLYIGGEGPMWDFDNQSAQLSKNGVSVPWFGIDFHTVIILNGVTTIGVEAFYGAQLSSVIIPSSIKTVKEIAFWDARIERLILPETIETIEEGILNGFRRLVDTLVISANIPNIKPFSLFNRDDILANKVILTGTRPENLTQLVDSRLFDDVGRYQIYYPRDWDTVEASLYERLLPKFPDVDDVFLQNLKNGLIPYDVG